MNKVYVLTGESYWQGHGESGITITLKTTSSWSSDILPAFSSMELAEKFIAENQAYRYCEITELNVH